MTTVTLSIARTVAMAGAALLAFTSPARADIIYDAYTSFNGTNGAGGFTYANNSSSGTTALTNTPCVINNTICLGLTGGAFNLPGVFKSTGIASTTHPYQPLDRLLVHPGASSALLAFFTAPTSATYNVLVNFEALTGSTSVGVFGGTNASGSFATFGTGFVNTANPSRTFGGSYALNAGQFIAVGLNNGGDFAGDSTALTFRVTQVVAAGVPEPTSWALMILGFGAVGAALRRRRVLAFA